MRQKRKRQVRFESGEKIQGADQEQVGQHKPQSGLEVSQAKNDLLHFLLAKQMNRDDHESKVLLWPLGQVKTVLLEHQGQDQDFELWMFDCQEKSIPPMLRNQSVPLWSSKPASIPWVQMLDLQQELKIQIADFLHQIVLKLFHHSVATQRTPQFVTNFDTVGVHQWFD